MAGHPESVINPMSFPFSKISIIFWISFSVEFLFKIWTVKFFWQILEEIFFIYNLPNFSFSKTKQLRDLIIFFVTSGITSVHELTLNVLGIK